MPKYSVTYKTTKTYDQTVEVTAPTVTDARAKAKDLLSDNGWIEREETEPRKTDHVKTKKIGDDPLKKIDWEHIFSNGYRRSVRIFIQPKERGNWQFLSAVERLRNGQVRLLTPEGEKDVKESLEDQGDDYLEQYWVDCPAEEFNAYQDLLAP